MIRLNVFLAVADNKAKETVKKLGAELVAASRKDKGCVAYDMTFIKSFISSFE